MLLYKLWSYPAFFKKVILGILLNGGGIDWGIFPYSGPWTGRMPGDAGEYGKIRQSMLPI